MMKKLIVLMAVVLSCIGCAGTKKPEEEQIKSDFIEKVLNGGGVTIGEFVLESETAISDEQYVALINITYDNGEVESVEKYRLIYEKQDEWTLKLLEEYEKDSWKKYPLTTPDKERYIKLCMEMLADEAWFSDYDKIDLIEEHAEEDLEAGEIYWYFEVANKEVVESISGEIKFCIVFDKSDSKWVVDGYSYCDSYSVVHDVVHSWSGKGTDMGEHLYDIEPVGFVLNIDSYEENNASATLTYGGHEYSLNGTIYGYEYGGCPLEVDLENREKRIHVEGTLELSGELGAVIDTAYNPDTMLYRPIDRYYVEMQIQ